MEEIIKIPKERIAILIGTKGETTKAIYKKTKIHLNIDSGTGEVLIEGEGEDFFKAVDIVKAIGRGFSPERAFNLSKKDCLLKIIEIPEFTGKNASAQEAKRGRVIGKHGQARKEIEKSTGAMISVYGKTVSIIADVKDIEKATDAVELLLQGSSHETVEHFLKHEEKGRFEL
jgi:ribosomal RNA assembly protein